MRGTSLDRVMVSVGLAAGRGGGGGSAWPQSGTRGVLASTASRTRTARASTRTLEAVVESQAEAERAVPGEGLRDVEPDASRVNTQPHVGPPRVQGRELTAWHLARTIPHQPGLSRVAEDHQVHAVNAHDGPAFGGAWG